MRIVLRRSHARLLAAQAQHVGGVPVDHAELVRDEQDREAVVLLKAADQLVQLLLPWLINARRRLIEQEHVGIADKGERDEQTLELPARQDANRLLGDVCRDADEGQRARHARVRLPGQRRPRAQEVHAGDRHVAFEIELLRHVADPRPRLPTGRRLHIGSRR